MDGTHIRLATAPSARKDATEEEKKNWDPAPYFNYKGFYSIQLFAVCGLDKKIKFFRVGDPGSYNDGRCYDLSKFQSFLSSPQWRSASHLYFLADSAFPIRGQVITPYKNVFSLTSEQKRFNFLLSHTRILIEHVFGLLKGRFAILKKGIPVALESASMFVRAVVVLHNILQDVNDEHIWERVVDLLLLSEDSYPQIDLDDPRQTSSIFDGVIDYSNPQYLSHNPRAAMLNIVRLHRHNSRPNDCLPEFNSARGLFSFPLLFILVLPFSFPSFV
jgi:hypothetical protein